MFFLVSLLFVPGSCQVAQSGLSLAFFFYFGIQSARIIDMSQYTKLGLTPFFLKLLGLNSGSCACWASALPLEPCPQPIFALVIFHDLGFCWGLASGSSPPTHYFLNSLDLRHVPPHPGYWLRWGSC
jgi:hypothetical protein